MEEIAGTCVSIQKCARDFTGLAVKLILKISVSAVISGRMQQCIVGVPFEKIAIDVVEPVPKSRSRYRFLLLWVMSVNGWKKYSSKPRKSFRSSFHASFRVRPNF